MFSRKLFLALWMMLAVVFCSAQRIVYSEPERDDSRRLNFEIVGKIGGNFLIYKNIRNKNWITVMDNDMNVVSREEQDYVPDNDRMINADFFPYGDFAYMIYQYQRKNIVYCMASKIDGNGKLVGDVMELDTSHIGFAADNRIYTVLTNENKSQIAVFKINSKNRKLYVMTTLLYDNNLSLARKSVINIPMEERNDYLGEFQLDNGGNLVFSRFVRKGNDNISEASFIIKHAQADTLLYKALNLEKTWLDEIHIKIDNSNNRIFLTSFYYNERRGNVDGLYFYVWDMATSQPILENINIFSDELRREARGESGTKTAFNNFFIQDIITRRDGGFLIASEAYYTTSRYNAWNRWDYLYGSPLMSPMWNNYYYSPYYNRYWMNSRFYGSNNRGSRYHADNIVVFSFDGKGQPEWNNVIGKAQFNDENDDLISYQLMNTGSEIHFLFNQPERRNNLLTDFAITPDGTLSRNPTLKNLDRGHEFMTKYGKQVSSKQMIIPCIYRNSICFAKIEYN